MLRRPKPTDSEADLLREQQELLAAGGQSSVTVVKRPDKRRGDAAAADAHEQRDVVTIEGKLGRSELARLRGASRTGTAPRQYREGLRKGALKPPFRSRESPPSGRVFTRPSLSSTPCRLTGSSQAEVTASIV